MFPFAQTERANDAVSMPSVSGWPLRPLGTNIHKYIDESFYALGIGLAFATLLLEHDGAIRTVGFYALGIGLAFATFDQAA